MLRTRLETTYMVPVDHAMEAFCAALAGLFILGAEFESMSEDPWSVGVRHGQS